VHSVMGYNTDMESAVSIYPSLAKSASFKTSPVKPFFDAICDVCKCDYLPFFSARSALLAGIKALGLNRSDEILVPPFLGHCVLSAMEYSSFATLLPNNNVKAILVLHQFGFPQNIELIQTVAEDKGWLILNDCAHALYAKAEIGQWGDISIVSFSKFFQCGQGGGLLATRHVLERLPEAMLRDAEIVATCFNEYAACLVCKDAEERLVRMSALYGYIPFLRGISTFAAGLLPQRPAEILDDKERRIKYFRMAVEALPHLENIYDETIVPMAIPVSGPPNKLQTISESIRSQFGVITPVMHFDFAQNMLQPDYRPALMIGCHEGWSEEVVADICTFLRGRL